MMEDDRDGTAPFLLTEPARPSVPFVFNVPHSGRYYPPDLMAATGLDLVDLRAMEDCLMDELVQPALAGQAPLLVNHFARAYVDTNRDARELDPRIINAPLPENQHTTSDRVRAGLGVIPAIAGGGRAIYRQPLCLRRIEERLARVYKPTHDALAGLLVKTHASFGCAVLVDCHSMPGAPLGGLGLGGRSPDVVIGDRHGRSATPLLVDTLVAAFKEQGYAVVRNTPYAGGYNAECYGAPAAGVHAVQIEISRDLYLNERTLALTAGAGRTVRGLAAVFRRLFALPAQALAARPLPAAAE